MADLKKLRAASQEAEDAAHKLQAEKDDALKKLREKYAKRLRKANDDAAAAQKALADAEAAEALKDRPGGAELAEALGLTLPE
jgi:ElaB/YqjD/DUF883 family membrane-anchored ribosome-binding protein